VRRVALVPEAAVPVREEARVARPTRAPVQAVQAVQEARVAVVAVVAGGSTQTNRGTTAR
jgi:hypothetical protein